MSYATCYMLYVSIHICIVPKIPISTGCRGANIGPMPVKGRKLLNSSWGPSASFDLFLGFRG